ncbi:MAG: hypothetical protein WDZ80_05780 [Candidatus Paceibacterota bacterium]
MVTEFINFTESVLLAYWWLIIPPFLILLLADLWLFYKREEYKRGIEWNLIEISIPKEIEKTPKAMEQIFTSVQASYSFGVRFVDKWFKGKIEGWMSFEIVGRAGRIHFYVRMPKNYRNMIESAVYSQYPEAEINLISEEEDYVKSFPQDVPDGEYDIFGTDIVLARDDAYPIRTYEYFEHPVKEEKRIDPIASMMEIMNKLKSYETIWLQLLIRPNDGSWVKRAEELIGELRGEKKKSNNPFAFIGTIFKDLAEFLSNLLVAPFRAPVWDDGSDKKEEKSNNSNKNRKKIEAIEEKISKTGFDTCLRFLYIDRKDDFTSSNISGVMGALQQFNIPDLNSLRPNLATMTIARQPFKKRKIIRKKRQLFAFARVREFPRKFSVFNVEELATLYHFPIGGVKSPILRRVTNKKGGPPVDLPIDE